MPPLILRKNFTLLCKMPSVYGTNVNTFPLCRRDCRFFSSSSREKKPLRWKCVMPKITRHTIYGRKQFLVSGLQTNGLSPFILLHYLCGATYFHAKHKQSETNFKITFQLKWNAIFQNKCTKAKKKKNTCTSFFVLEIARFRILCTHKM